MFYTELSKTIISAMVGASETPLSGMVQKPTFFLSMCGQFFNEGLKRVLVNRFI